MKSQSGFLLVSAIFLLVVLAALGAFILTISGTQQSSSALDVQGARAYQAARAGIEWASYQVLTRFNNCPSGYLYGRTVTINHTKVPNTDQSNFPMLFSGTYAGAGGSLDLRTEANGGKVKHASGFDIIFTDSNATKLDHEIESYAAATGAVTFWVRVPTVSHTTDTVISICYGNAAITTSQENKTGVWDANYVGVWHLNEATAANRLDSTNDVNTLTPSASNPTLVAGKIAGAANFVAASPQFLAISDAAQTGLDLGTQFTLEVWAKSTNTTSNQSVLSKYETPTNQRSYVLRWSNDRHSLLCSPDGGSANEEAANASGVTFVANTWYHLLVVYNSPNIDFYYNGTWLNTRTYLLGCGAPFNGTGPFNIGSRSSGSTQAFDGAIDEARVSNALRSADWVTTDYNSQSSPSTFYTVGGTESAAGVFAANCTPGPTTQNVTGMGGTLSGFTATVTCSSTATSEAGATVTLYQITSTGFKGTAGTLDRVERQLQATLNK